jgi:hypothetical protein
VANPYRTALAIHQYVHPMPLAAPALAADEAAALRAVAGVTSLRSLVLKGGVALTAEGLRQHASALRCLSSLTGLASLSLQVID